MLLYTIDGNTVLQSLQLMWQGMAGIFLVIILIFLLVLGLGKLFPDKKK